MLNIKETFRISEKSERSNREGMAGNLREYNTIKVLGMKRIRLKAL